MPLSTDNTIDYFGNDSPVCPHCDHEADIAENEWWFLYDEATHYVDCPDCGKEYQVGSRAKWTFSTDEQEDS